MHFANFAEHAVDFALADRATGRREQLKLDGEQLELADIALNGKPLGKKDYKLTDTSLTLTKTPSEPFTLEITTYVNPEANKALQGSYSRSVVDILRGAARHMEVEAAGYYRGQQAAA